MPTYVYKFVDTGETIEIQQSFSDATLTEAVHPATGAAMPVKKVFQPVGVTFKGDGFYKTDSRASKSSKKTSAAGESSNGSSTSDTSKAETPKADAPKSDTSKPAAASTKPSSSSSSSSSD